MTTARITGIAVLLIAQGLVGCSASNPASPASNPASPAGVPTEIFVFTESRTGFSTTDLHDVDEQVLQFHTTQQLIWAADGTRLPGYRVGKETFGSNPEYYIEGKICPEGCAFVVRFGTKDGQRRAYLTVDYGHSNPGTLVDVDVADGALVVTQTSVFPPGSSTLFGRVTEIAPAGPVPVAHAWVSRLVQGGWRDTQTDSEGLYTIPGLYDATDKVAVGKDGYQSEERQVSIRGDTRFDIELVRR